MKRLAVIANCGKARAAEVVRKLAAAARVRGLELVADHATAALAPGLEQTAPPALFDGADAVVALGGDGTMLRVVRDLDGRDLPVMGVNIGGLGFLTSVAEEDLDRGLGCLASGDFTTQPRNIAECVVRRGATERERYRALNDVVVHAGPLSRVITLDVEVNGSRVTSYVCDGLIVSTPTGSTGHSLSAGGPILLPETRAWVVSLICPHTLSSRPLVVPDSMQIAVSTAVNERVMLSVDGQVGGPVLKGDRVIVKASDRCVRFVRLPGHDHFAVLRQKLGWKGSNV